MTSAIFKKSVAFSLAGHLMAFSFFNASFGRQLPGTDYAAPVFLGSVFKNFSPALKTENPVIKNLDSVAGRLDIENLRARAENASLTGKAYLKPVALLQPLPGKAVFIQKAVLPKGSGRGKPVLMFYPRLPPYFSLYFKDRQVVHIKLMFRTAVGTPHSPLLIRRKISSGNLEADLLCMRYISRYLYLQQEAFSADSWQTVGIELSAKDT